MAKKGNLSYVKRQREIKKKEIRQEKIERRKIRSEEKKNGVPGEESPPAAETEEQP
ncbi:hypothetical protein [Leptospira neocaledonica]|uniref:hypothetical protein n=1 Tax=Leptospira neocaledonica TaxID=2023192 RepID=UPI0013FDD26A|nr:hypothetical protein [Leptospira neocaledonica]